MTVPLLHEVRPWDPRLKIRKAGKRVGSCPVREVVHSPPADVRNVHAKNQLLLPADVGQELRSIEVILRTPRITLRATSRKRP